MGMWACTFVTTIFLGIPADFEEEKNPYVQGTYYSLYSVRVDWNNVASYCRSLHKDAHLVTIKSADEENIVDSYIQGRYAF